MNKEVTRINKKPRSYEIDVKVEYIPFPDGETRCEAYHTHVRLFLKAKEREFMEKLKDKIPDESKRIQVTEELLEKRLRIYCAQRKG